MTTTQKVLSGAATGLLVAAAAWVVGDAWTERRAAREAGRELRAEVERLRARAAERPRLEAERAALERNVGAYVQILPAPEVATQERLMERVQEAAERARFPLVCDGPARVRIEDRE